MALQGSDNAPSLRSPKTTDVWPEEVKSIPPGQGPRGAPRTGLRVASGTRKAPEVQQRGAQLTEDDGRQSPSKEGGTGPITAAFACVRATRKRGRRPDHQVWLIFRRGLEPGAEIQYDVRNASAKCPRTTLVRMRGLRWPVETALEAGKTALGMDHYATRAWRGWHHQRTMTFLAHHFLLRLRLK